MAGHCMSFILAISTFRSLSLVTALSTEVCAEDKAFALKFCNASTCREKCNKTIEEMQSSDPLQTCKCDEKCVMFDDCCGDFASVCPGTYQAGTEKYQQFFAACYGNMTVITRKKRLSLSTLGSTPFSGESSTAPLPTVEESEAVQFPMWIVFLPLISSLKIDREHGILILNTLAKDIARFKTKALTVSSIKRIEAYMHMKKPFKQTEGIGDTVPGSLIEFNIPQTLTPGRLCLRKKYSCRQCKTTINLDHLCHRQTAQTTFKETETGKPIFNDTVVETQTRKEPELVCIESVEYPTSTEHDDRVKVIVEPGPLRGMFMFYSEDLPWSVVHCWRHPFSPKKCVIQSCAAERVLSSDGQACFIPTRLSVFIVQRIALAASSLTVEERKKSHDTLETVSVPTSLCFYILQILKSHMLWKLKEVSVRRHCRFGVDFKGSKPVKESKAKLLVHRNQNRTNLFNVSQHQEMELDFTKDELTLTDNRRNASVARMMEDENPGVFGTTDYDPDGMLQAQDLIQHHHVIFPKTAQAKTLILCLECPPDPSCLKPESEESCRNRSSKCLSFKIPEASTTSSKTPSTLGPVAILTLVLISLTIVNSEH